MKYLEDLRHSICISQAEGGRHVQQNYHRTDRRAGVRIAGVCRTDCTIHEPGEAVARAGDDKSAVKPDSVDREVHGSNAQETSQETVRFEEERGLEQYQIGDFNEQLEVNQLAVEERPGEAVSLKSAGESFKTRPRSSLRWVWPFGGSARHPRVSLQVVAISAVLI
jgi:hypothetical protein